MVWVVREENMKQVYLFILVYMSEIWVDICDVASFKGKKWKKCGLCLKKYLYNLLFFKARCCFSNSVCIKNLSIKADEYHAVMK